MGACEVEIIIEGQLDEHWMGWFSPLSLRVLPGGKTCLTGRLEDQSALRGVIEHIFDLNLTLVALTTHPIMADPA